MTWFKQSVDSVLDELETRQEGLSDQEAKRRLEEHGENRIQEEEGVSAWQVLLHQFTSPLIYVLIAALTVTIAIQSWSDVIVIAVVLVINATIGFIQEYRAESAVQSLMQMITPKATVVRNGREQEIDSKHIVPGDIVRLEQGSMIPADVRLVDVRSLQVNEAALTGESVPISKESRTLQEADKHLPTADQVNMAFMGTAVTSGKATGVVVATGQDTQIGEIAEQVQQAGQIETPLERRIRRLTKWITAGILIVAAIAVGVGWYMGRDIFEMIQLGVALAVAAIPAGLPIVVTVALALRVRSMAERHALIRHLHAVDTLGSTTMIVSDKTGTITQNQMTVRGIYTGGHRYEVTGGGLTLEGDVEREGEKVEPQEGSPLWRALLVGCLCNEARIYMAGTEETETEDSRSADRGHAAGDGLRVQGDPMEGALLVAAAKAGLDRDRLEKRFPRRDVVPFKTERRFMATIHDIQKDDDGGRSPLVLVKGGDGDRGPLVLVKGAPEKILDMCTERLDTEGNQAELDHKHIMEWSERLAAEGLRVLGMAVGFGPEIAESVKNDNPSGLIFAGLQGMFDPPRRSAIEAVDRCHEAGIRVLMVTGDHASTAATIARKAHLDRSVRTSQGPEQQRQGQESRDLPHTYTGQQLDAMSKEEIDRVLNKSNVFARVEPKQKLRLVDRLKAQDEVVAVTGDGVNDAPALKTAHIGAAMGSGTDVAKQASDMIITDDNLASVYAAVEEGRTAFRNIRMATFFLLSTGAADILIILTALGLGWPLPLLPAQILWVNVVTNGIADVALAFEPGEKALYQQPPRPPKEGVLDHMLLERLVLVGIWLSAGVLYMFWRTWDGDDTNLTLARTAAMTTLILFQMVHVFNCRSEDISIFRKSLLANKVLFLGVLASLGVHIAALYLPWTQELLSLTPMSWETWLWAIGIALSAIIVNELHKLLRPSSRRREAAELERRKKKEEEASRVIGPEGGRAVMEVVTSVRHRRKTVSEKLRINEKALRPGMNFAFETNRRGVTSSIKFQWNAQADESSISAEASTGGTAQEEREMKSLIEDRLKEDSR